MSITGIQSVNVFARQPDAVSRTLDDVLSLPVLRRADGVTTFYTGKAGAQLNVLRATGDDTRNVGRATGIALRVHEVGDLDGVGRRIEAKLGRAEVSAFPGGNRLELRDPDDNRLHLVELHEADDSPTLFDGPASVSVRVRNLRAAMEFYVGLLELPMNDTVVPGLTSFFHRGTRLWLTERPGLTPAAPVEGETGICFALDDAERSFDELMGRGARFSVPPRLLGPAWIAALRDPDGNVFTLYGKAT